MMKSNVLVRGMRDSSVVCSLHFRTPTSLLRGNDFSGFFRPITDSAVNNFLSTFGCVWVETNTIVSTPITSDLIGLHYSLYMVIRINAVKKTVSFTAGNLKTFTHSPYSNSSKERCRLNHKWWLKHNCSTCYYVIVGDLTCNCNPLLSLLLMMRRMRPFLSSVTLSVTKPSNSMFCRPPSRPQVSEIFSSTRRWTLRRTTQQMVNYIYI